MKGYLYLTGLVGVKVRIALRHGDVRRLTRSADPGKVNVVCNELAPLPNEGAPPAPIRAKLLLRVYEVTDFTGRLSVAARHIAHTVRVMGFDDALESRKRSVHPGVFEVVVRSINRWQVWTVCKVDRGVCNELEQ